jgi:hypothetical protein
MAKQENSQLVGTVGNLIFYKYRGQYCVRMKPNNVRQTNATLKSGLNFGKASQIGRQIREMIWTINPCKSDNAMIYKFTGALNKMIYWKEKMGNPFMGLTKNPGYIGEFQFNYRADMPFVLQPAVTVPESGLLQMRLVPMVPAEDLNAPYDTDHILLKIIITSTSLTEMKTEKTNITEVRIPCNHEIFYPDDIVKPVNTNPGRLIMIVLAIEYFINENGGTVRLTGLKKMPCNVIWSGWV